jgi:hypothetical protein
MSGSGPAADAFESRLATPDFHQEKPTLGEWAVALEHGCDLSSRPCCLGTPSWVLSASALHCSVSRERTGGCSHDFIVGHVAQMLAYVPAVPEGIIELAM